MSSTPSLPESWRALPAPIKLQLLERLKKTPTQKSRSTRQQLPESYKLDPCGFIEKELGSQLTEEQRDVCNSVRDNTVTIVKSANSVGKTYDAARIAIWFYKNFEPAQVYTTAAPPEANLKRLLWGEIGTVVAENFKLFSDDQVNTLNIARSPQSFIAGVTIPASGTEQQREAKFSGKHSPNLLFIVDEGDAVPDEVYRGIEACMSGGNAKLLVMFNPRHESGPVYRKERDHQGNVISLSAFNHPNVTTGLDQIPGAVTRQKTVKRINEWSRPVGLGERTDSECFEVPEFLVGSVARSDNEHSYEPLPAGVRKITDPAFSYMVLGQYPSQSETQLISKSWIAAARSRWDLYVAKHGEVPPAGTRPIQGQDCAEFGVDHNVACFRYGGWVPRLITWNGVDPIETGDRAAKLYQDRKAIRVNVDATGVGAGVAPHMSRLGCNAVRVMVASSPTQRTEQGEFKILRDQLMWSVREWLRKDPGAMLPPDERLLEELATPTYEIIRGKIQVMAKDDMKALLKRSPDRYDALALTFDDRGDLRVDRLRL